MSYLAGSELGQFASMISSLAAHYPWAAGLFVFGSSCGFPRKAGITLLTFGFKPFIDFGLDPGNTVFTKSDRCGELSSFDKAANMNGVKVNPFTNKFDSKKVHGCSPVVTNALRNIPLLQVF
jgi:hypothetical protein